MDVLRVDVQPSRNERTNECAGELCTLQDAFPVRESDDLDSLDSDHQSASDAFLDDGEATGTESREAKSSIWERVKQKFQQEIKDSVNTIVPTDKSTAPTTRQSRRGRRKQRHYPIVTFVTSSVCIFVYIFMVAQASTN